MKIPVDTARCLRDKRLLIFDFDGTVADTSPLHTRAFNQVLAPFGITVDYSTIAGLKTTDALRQCLDQHAQDLSAEALDALVLAKQQAVRAMIGSGLEPLPSVDAFLRWVRPRYHLSMATSGSRGTVQLALEKLGYGTWFSPLLCADDVRQTKPDPEIFLNVLSLTGYLPDQAVVFEDSDAGIAAAKSAGIMCIDVRGFSWVINEMRSSCGN
jgi:sugar-phosphatase